MANNLELLIDLIQQYPHIYDKSSANFKNEQMKLASYRQIAETLQTTADEVIRLWRNLRDRYGRERRKVPPSGSGAVTIPEWPFLKNLSFLAKPRHTYSSTKRSSSCLNEDEDTQVTHENELVQDEYLNQPSTSEEQCSSKNSTPLMSVEPLRLYTTAEPTPKRKKGRMQEGADSLVKIAKDITNHIRAVRSEQRPTVNTRFAEYIALRLDELPEDEAKKLRKTIVNFIEGD